jgi:hypothetical protein
MLLFALFCLAIIIVDFIAIRETTKGLRRFEADASAFDRQVRQAALE